MHTIDGGNKRERDAVNRRVYEFVRDLREVLARYPSKVEIVVQSEPGSEIFGITLRRDEDGKIYRKSYR